MPCGRRPSASRKGRRHRATRTPPRTTVSTSPGCSPAVRCSPRRADDVSPDARPGHPAEDGRPSVCRGGSMKLENNFTIDAPVEKAWEALNSPETVAPCFPGATLTEYEGDSFTGTVKVKLGPIAMTYKGKGTYVTRDEAAHEVVIDASGRDSRGNGTATAKVTASLAADGPDKTAVSMVTDMTITGKPAQFGRGVISDVADKIIGQFSACVARKLGEGESSASTESPASSVEEGAVAVSAAPAPASPASSAASEAISDIPTPTTIRKRSAP